MKSILFSFLFLFSPRLAISQVSPNDLLIYLDSIENNASVNNFTPAEQRGQKMRCTYSSPITIRSSR